MDSMVPTGRPRGIDLVAAGGEHLSPGLMRESGVRLLITMWPVAVPRRMARMRVVASRTPAPEVWSLMSSTCEVWGKTSRSLPTMPSGVMTAWSGLRPSLRALVDIEDAGEIGAAGADDLRGDGGGDVVLLEVEQGLQAMALEGVLRERGLLEAEAGDLLLKVVVLLAGVAEIDVVGPAVADVIADAMEESLEWRDGGDSPVAEKRDLVAVWGAGFDGPPTWMARPMVCASRIATRTRTFLKRVKKDSMR